MAFQIQPIKPFQLIVAVSIAIGAASGCFAGQDASTPSYKDKRVLRQSATSKPAENVNSVETKTIYRQVMKDGSVVFSDVGSQGAVKTAAIPYQSTSSSSAMLLASQQKEHWRRQSEGFNQRQAQRDTEFEQARRERLYNQQLASAREYGWYGPAPRVIYGLGGQPVRGHFPQQGVSGVGAAHNVPSSFIGSGFATASPLAPNFGGGRR
jgi:hypothetical protein